jgi:hypothetical protein
MHSVNSSSTLALLLHLDFKFMKANFDDLENMNIQQVPFHFSTANIIFFLHISRTVLKLIMLFSDVNAPTSGYTLQDLRCSQWWCWGVMPH